MARRSSIWLALSVAFATLTGLTMATPGHAQELPLELQWPALPECPESAVLVAGIRDAVDLEASPGGPRIMARARLEPLDDQWVLVLTTERAGQADNRTLRATSCEALAEAAVVILALLIDPNARLPEPEDPDGSSVDSPVESSDDSSTDSSDAETEPNSEASTDTSAQLENASGERAPTEDAGSDPLNARPEASERSSQSPEDAANVEAGAPAALPLPYRWTLAVGVAADVGLLEGTSAGLSAGGTLRAGPVRFGIRAAYFPSRFVEADASAGGNLQAVDASVSAQWVFPWVRGEVGPTLEVTGAALFGEGTGISDPETSVAPAFSVGGGLRGSLRLFGPLFVELLLTARLGVFRPEFEIGGVGQVHRPALLTGRGLVRLGAGFD